MCGRFTLALSPEDVAKLLELNVRLDRELGLAPRWNVAPGQEILAALKPEAAAPREPRLLRWGLVPRWAKDPNVGYRMLNARSETAREKPAFRDAFQSRRCLVPADGFYEWKREGKAKQPWLFHLKDEPAFALAGLWERWTGDDGEVIDSCTLLTTTPNELMATVHDRMPVILPRDRHADWLDAPPGDAAALLRPYPAEAMTAWPVSTRVNSPRHDGPELVEPVEAAGGEQGALF